jgi:nucleoside-diphosphate-sugar epimerase
MTSGLSVLVTGAAGGLGRTICRVLNTVGVRVRALVRPEDDLCLVPLDQAGIKVGYVQDPDAVAAAAAGVDAIIHCAALLPNSLRLGAAAFLNVNVGGTITVFETAIAQNVPAAVFFSTISVVDHNTRTVARDELPQFVPGPNDAYLASKIEAERILSRRRSEYRVHLAIVRPAFIYGPGNYAVWKEPLRLTSEGKMALIGDGRATFPLIYAEDLACYVLALISGPRFDPPYDIHVVANREPTTMNDVFDFIADYLGVQRPPSPLDFRVTPSNAPIQRCIDRGLPVFFRGGLTIAHAQDVARGHLLAMEKGIPGQRYILGGDHITIQDYFKLISELCGRRAPILELPQWLMLALGYGFSLLQQINRSQVPFTYDQAKHSLRKYGWYSSEKARAALGYSWRPVREAVASYIEWVRGSVAT